MSFGNEIRSFIGLIGNRFLTRFRDAGLVGFSVGMMTFNIEFTVIYFTLQLSHLPD